MAPVRRQIIVRPVISLREILTNKLHQLQRIRQLVRDPRSDTPELRQRIRELTAELLEWRSRIYG